MRQRAGRGVGAAGGVGCYERKGTSAEGCHRTAAHFSGDARSEGTTEMLEMFGCRTSERLRLPARRLPTNLHAARRGDTEPVTI
jgi:hypothetical protein